jgi:hypothetical protein
MANCRMLLPPVRNRNLRRPHNRMPAPCKAQWPAACPSSDCCWRSRWCFPTSQPTEVPSTAGASSSRQPTTVLRCPPSERVGWLSLWPGDQQSRGIRTGGAGYGKRFGADIAGATSANMFGTFLVASLTHQDPRVLCEEAPQFQGVGKVRRDAVGDRAE